MPKNRSKTPKGVSDAVANSQNSNIYFLARRNRAQGLSDVEQRKLTATLANESAPYGWGLTASCQVVRILTKGIVTGWRIRLHKKKL